MDNLSLCVGKSKERRRPVTHLLVPARPRPNPPYKACEDAPGRAAEELVREEPPPAGSGTFRTRPAKPENLREAREVTV